MFKITFWFRCNFNSIKVQLEQIILNKANRTYWNFNSIKVQLERAAAGAAAGGVPFQFHKGTIRTQATIRQSVQ